jgi:hypothetical protein
MRNIETATPLGIADEVASKHCVYCYAYVLSEFEDQVLNFQLRERRRELFGGLARSRIYNVGDVFAA